jgi:ABC-type Fe3+-siderophore transport system permease subunit
MLISIYSALFFISNLTDALGFITTPVERKFYYGFVTLFEYSLFFLFLFFSIKNKKAKKAILISSAVYITFLIAYTLIVKIRRINSVPIGIETLLILIYSFYYLFEQMNDPKTLFIYSRYQFWVLVGFMLYLSGSFFIYIFTNQLPQPEVLKYWFIIDIFLILKNVFFITALLTFIIQQKKKTPPNSYTLKAIY